MEWIKITYAVFALALLWIITGCAGPARIDIGLDDPYYYHGGYYSPGWYEEDHGPHEWRR